MEIKDEEIRKELSKVLNCYVERGIMSKPDNILSWIEIAFEIGKLKDEKIRN